MKELLIYILKTSICLSAFMLIYLLFLRHSTFFLFNRIYLLSGIILSFFIPTIHYKYNVYIPINSLDATIINQAVETTSTSIPDIWLIIGIIYFISICTILFKTFYSGWKLLKLTRINSERHEGYTLIDSNNIRSPFSVFHYILLNTENLSPTETELIIKHEISHIRQRHWIDLLIGQLLLITQWFNPLAWKYVALQKENHEYLADRAVIREGISPTLYGAVLINQRFEGAVFSFSSSFNFSNPLNRLTMITKTKTSSWKKISVLIIIPLMGIYLWSSAKPNYIFTEFTEPIVVQDDTEQKNAYQSHNDSLKIKIDAMTTGSVKIITRNAQVANTPESEISNKVFLYTTSGEKNIEKLDEILLIVDGEIVSAAELKNLDENQIEKIKVIKEQKVMEKYGDKAKNGIIEITTKKNK